MVLLRPSPNEEARMLQEERDRRRKMRLQQVREQSKVLAAKARESVKEVVNNEYEKLAQELEQEFVEKKRARERFLQEMYLKSIKGLGEAHESAQEAREEMKYESRRSEESALENHKKAIKRHHEAVTHQKFEQSLKYQHENRHIFAREKALALEKERAMLVASLPEPVDPLAPQASSKTSEQPLPKCIPVVDYDGHLGTYLETSPAFVENERVYKHEDGREAASREDRKKEFEAKCQMMMQNEQREKARLRGIAAMSQVQVENDYGAMCEQLESMKQQDLHRRQANVAKISKNIFLPPHRREEEKVDHQNKLEEAFEQIYSSKPGASDAVELQMSALVESSSGNEDKEDSVVSLEFSTAGATANPLLGVVKKKADQNNNGEAESKDEQPLQKLLAKINSQREQLSRQHVKVIEQYEPLVAVDDTTQTSATSSNGHDSGQDYIGGEKGNFESSDEVQAPIPYEPKLLAEDLKSLKDKCLDLSMEVPCRDTDETTGSGGCVDAAKKGQPSSFDVSEPIITSGPCFKAKQVNEAGVQVGWSPSKDNVTADLTNVTLDSTLSERDASPVSRYLEAVSARELSSSSIEENLRRIREKNQQLLAKYQANKNKYGAGLTHRSNSSEESAPTKDVGLNRSKEKADLDSSRATKDTFYVPPFVYSTYSKAFDSLEDSNNLTSQNTSKFASQNYLSDSFRNTSNKFEASHGLTASKQSQPMVVDKPQRFGTSPYPFDYPTAQPDGEHYLENHEIMSLSSEVSSSSMTSVSMSDFPTPTNCRKPVDDLNFDSRMQLSAANGFAFNFVMPGSSAFSLSPLNANLSDSSDTSSRYATKPVRPRQQMNVFTEDFSKPTAVVQSSVNWPRMEGQAHVSGKQQGSNLGDPTIDWLLEKYRDLEIEYDTESIANSEPFPEQASSSLINDMNIGAERTSASDKREPLCVDKEKLIGKRWETDSVEDIGLVTAQNQNENFARSLSPRVDPLPNRAEQNNVSNAVEQPSYAPGLIEIKGQGRNRISDASETQQDLTVVTPLPTPLVQETPSMNFTSQAGDQTNPFTPEMASSISMNESPPQDHSTPCTNLDEEEIHSLDTSGSSSKASFVVVDGDNYETRQVSFSLLSVSEQSFKMKKPSLELKEEKIFSPIFSSGGTSKTSITPESGSSSDGKSESPLASGSGSSSAVVSLSPETVLERTLVSDVDRTPTNADTTKSTPVVTSALAERRSQPPSQQFLHVLPTIDSVELDPMMLTSERSASRLGSSGSRSSQNSPRGSDNNDISTVSGVSLKGTFISPEVMSATCTSMSADTLEERNHDMLETIPQSSLSRELDEFTNSSPGTNNEVTPESNGSTVSTLAVNRASGAVLETIAPVPTLDPVSFQFKEQQFLKGTGLDNDTTVSSLGLLDVNGLNTSLNETRSSVGSSKTSKSCPPGADTSRMSRNWAKELQQYRLTDDDIASVKSCQIEGRKAATNGGQGDRGKLREKKEKGSSSTEFSVEQERKGSQSTVKTSEDLNNSSDPFGDVSGISLIRERDSSQTDKVLNDSLISFRRHEEELLRTDITQDDLVLSFNSSEVKRSFEAELSLRRSKELPLMSVEECAEDKVEVGAEVMFVGEEEAKCTPTLQELFNARMKKFIEASETRQLQKSQRPATSHLTPKQVVKQRWAKNQLSKPVPAAVKNVANVTKSGAAGVKNKELKTKEDRKLGEEGNKMRTKKLYGQLEEVKRAEEAKKRQEEAMRNRQKALEYSKKISRKKQNSSGAIVSATSSAN